MKGGSAKSAILRIKKICPRIHLLDILQVVLKVRGGRPIPRKPHELRRIQDCGDNELVLPSGVVHVLGLNHLLHLDEVLHHAVPRGTPEEVVKTSRDKYPHWSALPPVVNNEGLGQVIDSSTRNGDPINMERVWGTNNCGISGLVEVVEHTVTQAHIQPDVRLDGVHIHAGGAHVGGVAGAVLYTLQDANFTWRAVQVIHGNFSTAALPVAANIAEWSHLTARTRTWWPHSCRT